MSDTPDPSTLNPEEAKPQIEVPAAGVSDEEVEYIQLDPRNLLDGIRQLQATNPDFNKLFNNEVGNAAARQTRTKYEPELKTLKQRLEEEQLQRRKLEILNMSEADITKRFGEDPEFASEYAKIVHHKPRTETADDPTEIIKVQFEDMMDEAKAAGLSDEVLGAIANKAANGAYSMDGVHWSVSLRRIQREIDAEVAKAPAATPKVNPAITKPGADIAPTSRGGVTTFPFKTTKEFKAYSLADQTKYLDMPGGLEYVTKLMESGK